MPTKAAVFDYLVWVPAVFYGIAAVMDLLSSDRPTPDGVIPMLMFGVLAAAHGSQSRRMKALEGRDSERAERS